MLPTVGVSEEEESKGVKINFSALEALLCAFHQLAFVVPALVRDVAGLYSPTGQPGDFKPAVLERKADSTTRLKATVQHAQKFIKQCREALKALDARIKVTSDADEKKQLVSSSIERNLSSLSFCQFQGEKRTALAAALRTSSNVSVMCKVAWVVLDIMMCPDLL